MLPPLIIPGIALAGRMLLSKYSGTPSPTENKSRFKLFPDINPRIKQTPPGPNPLQMLVGNLTATLSKITQRPVEEDYDAIVKRFLPENSKLLTPKYPANAKEILFADVDNDTQNEIIATYKANQEVRTMLLKKKNDHWHKINEISHPLYDSINYRSVADIIGTGHKQLLVGLTARENSPVLHGYLLDQNHFRELFSRKYDRFEVIRPTKTKNTAGKARLAIWNQHTTGYDINVMHWNNSQLEPYENNEPYYLHRVVPYHVERIKQSPDRAAHWYDLSHALLKAGAKQDALQSIDVGMSLDKKSEYRDKFLNLRKQITGK